MYNLNICFLIFTILSIFACTESSSPSSEGGGTILGTWNLVFLEFEGETSTTYINDGTVVTTEVLGMGENYDFQITYEDDATFHSTGSYDLITTTEVLGMVGHDTVSVTNEHNNGEYLFENNILTVYDSSGVETEATVTMLTEDVMIYSFNRKMRRTFGDLILDEDYNYEYRLER